MCCVYGCLLSMSLTNVWTMHGASARKFVELKELFVSHWSILPGTQDIFCAQVTKDSQLVGDR